MPSHNSTTLQLAGLVDPPVEAFRLGPTACGHEVAVEVDGLTASNPTAAALLKDFKSSSEA
eukprot:6748660-Karenia_brevis.AAC.1